MKHELNLPSHYGKNTEERLKNFNLDTKYDGYTLNDELEIVKCECSIENDGMWNYHNNYDSSQNVLKVGDEHKWWTPNKKEIKKIQKKHLKKALKVLSCEVKRLKSNYKK